MRRHPSAGDGKGGEMRAVIRYIFVFGCYFRCSISFPVGFCMYVIPRKKGVSISVVFVCILPCLFINIIPFMDSIRLDSARSIRVEV